MLDSILGLPSQIITTTGGLLNNLISIPGQIVGSVTGSIGSVANVAGIQLVRWQMSLEILCKELHQLQQTFCQVPSSSLVLVSFS